MKGQTLYATVVAIGAMLEHQIKFYLRIDPHLHTSHQQHRSYLKNQVNIVLAVVNH